nr:MAG TPA: hypothetical protein [Caudoviricetes sp.]
MLKEILAEYSFTKSLRIDPLYAQAQELKIKELELVLNKINKGNFKEYNDITYNDFVKDRLYNIPKSNFNFISKIPYGTNLKKLKVFETTPFIPNPCFVNNKYDWSTTHLIDRLLRYKPNIKSLIDYIDTSMYYNYKLILYFYDILVNDKVYDKIRDGEVDTIILKDPKYLKPTFKSFNCLYGLGFNVLYYEEL